jgi:hypothetical protein
MLEDLGLIAMQSSPPDDFITLSHVECWMECLWEHTLIDKVRETNVFRVHRILGKSAPILYTKF